MEALEEVGADLERAGAAERLRGDDSAGGDQRRISAEQHRLDRRVVGRDAFDRQVAAWRGSVDTGLLGFADRTEQRHLAVLVGIDADAKVHLAGPWVSREGFVDAEDGIAGRQVDAVKQGGCHREAGGEKGSESDGPTWCRSRRGAAAQHGSLARCGVTTVVRAGYHGQKCCAIPSK